MLDQHLSERAIVGCLLGTAVGDALGLPFEGLTPSRQARMFAGVDRYRFLFGRGMVSDDTDHTCFVAQSILKSGGDPELFERLLAHHLRMWLLCAPAGVGLATLRACLKLCAGVPPSRSGVRSAGNGPAMRSAIIGVCCGSNFAPLAELVHRSTRITHTDPKAEIGALAIAVAGHAAANGDAVDAVTLRRDFETAVPPARRTNDPALDEFRKLLDAAAASAERRESASRFAESLSMYRGVSGYVYHTVPVVLQSWLRHPTDFRSGIVDIIRAGGDTDSTAAILGALIGTRVGPEGIPHSWRSGLWEWPRSVEWMTTLGRNLTCGTSRSLSTASWQIPIRNTIFTSAVLAHGLRRLLPPY